MPQWPSSVSDCEIVRDSHSYVATGKICMVSECLLLFACWWFALTLDPLTSIPYWQRRISCSLVQIKQVLSLIHSCQISIESHVLTADILQLAYCCRHNAAGILKPAYCSRHTAASILQLVYCSWYTAAIILQPSYCSWYTAAGILQPAYCSWHGWYHCHWSMLTWFFHFMCLIWYLMS